MEIPDFTKYFQDGFELEDYYYGRCIISRLNLGNILLPSGKIVACDPLVFPDSLPFRNRVQPGEYSVDISVLNLESGDKRVALAKIQFVEQNPVKWHLAMNAEAEDESDVDCCYGVDSGTGCFMSEEAAVLLAARIYDEDLYLSFLQDEIEKNYVHTYNYINLTISSKSRLNMVAFSSGFGDGCYSTYWGLDKSDRIVCLVTDFNCLKADVEWKSDRLPA